MAGRGTAILLMVLFIACPFFAIQEQTTYALACCGRGTGVSVLNEHTPAQDTIRPGRTKTKGVAHQKPRDERFVVRQRGPMPCLRRSRTDDYPSAGRR